MPDMSRVKEGLWSLRLTHRYFGLRKALRYAFFLPLAANRDATIEGFKHIGLAKTGAGGFETLWKAPNPGFIWEVVENRCYEPSVDFAIHKNFTVVDAGANVGTFTVMAALKAKNGRVISLEPNSRIFELLRENVKLNKLANVTCLEAALSPLSGKARFYESYSGGSTRENYTTNFVSSIVEALSISDLMQRLGMDRIDLLKLDIEGAEFEILESLRTRENVDRIVLELHPTYGNVVKLVESLRSKGYEVSVKPALVGKGLLYAYARRA